MNIPVPKRSGRASAGRCNSRPWQAAKFHQARSGALLLEVLLACLLLGVSLVMLNTLSQAGQRMAVLGQLHSRAAIRCEVTLNELIVGAKFVPTKPISFDDDQDWMWTASVIHHDTGLQRLSVEVWQRGPLQNQSRVEMVRLVPANQVSQLRSLIDRRTP